MAAETMEFKTELKQLLEIIIHSLYSNREIFLRELISNASDAIDKLRFEGLTQAELLAEGEDYRIDITPDEEAGTLTIADNGIGMSREGIADQLGTIAKSGTRALLEQVKAAGNDAPELIGQFGVGFYASFMVADEVEVVSLAAGSDQAVRWVSDGQGTYTLSDAQRQGRGTSVILHLKDDAKEFLQDFRVRGLIKRYSDFVEHPIHLPVAEAKEGEEAPADEPVNSREAIWRKKSDDVSDEDYTAFYRQVGRAWDEPLARVHYRAEGMMEFSALLFVPTQRPFDLFSGDGKSGLQLYVQRVLISDDCDELLPSYLRFVKGVVESSDLPLNVSREMIQQHRVLTKIKSNLTRKVLDELKTLKAERYDDYVTFHKAFGVVLKEGLAGGEGAAEADDLKSLVLFSSLKTPEDQFITLDAYVDAMPDDQPAIYYLTGPEREALENSPYLEALKEKGWDALLLTDAVDEWLPAGIGTFRDKELKAADKGELEEAGEADEAQAKTYASLLESLGDELKDDVKEVRLSRRLKASAAVLVADEGEMGANMERIMQRMGQEGMPAQKRILELNGDHPAVQALQGLYEKDRSDARVIQIGRLLHDQAVIAEGSRIADPSAFGQRLADLITAAIGDKESKESE